MLSEEHISNVTKTSSNQYHMVFSPYCFPHTGETCFSVWTREFLSQISLWKESLHSLLQMLLGKNETSKKIAGLITYSSPARAQFLISLFPIHPETPGQQLQRARMRQRKSGTEDLVRGVRPRGRNQHSVFRKEFSG